MKRTFTILLSLISCFPLLAQQEAEDSYITWEEFVENFIRNAETDEGETAAASLENELERLEYLRLHPLQLNTVERKDLLALPFLNEEQTDSILSYRQQRRGFVSLGELQLIKDIDWFTRGYLSLFLRCDSAFNDPQLSAKREKNAIKLGRKLIQGHHEIETRYDQPLYKRAGYLSGGKRTKSNYYVGKNMRHELRYRYTYGREVAYGASLEKDSGEPVGKQKFYPYDYLSAYVCLRPKGRSWSFVAGDFDLRGEEGLLHGAAFVFSQTPAVNLRHRPYDFRPHTSMEESRYFRGAAASFEKNRWRAMAYVSFRRVDARFSERGDTARSLQTTGLHRTINEIARKSRLNALVLGGSAGYLHETWGITLNGNFTHFGLPLWPEERFYNKYYFRGRQAGGVSLGYYVRFGKKFFFKGETAVDHGLKAAGSQRLEYRPNPRIRMNLQFRYFSPAYRSLYGSCTQQGSRTTNEQGLTFNVLYRPQNWEVTSFVDLFRFPIVSYTTALPGAIGIEGFLQARYKYSARWSFLAYYRVKSRQQTVTGRKVLEFRHRNRLRLAATCSSKRFDLHAQADLSYAFRQTGKRSFGYMASVRADYRPLSALRLKGFFSYFRSDDYDAALYAYTPRLRYTAGFNAFAYHGLHGVIQADWQIVRPLFLGFRFSSTHYFDRNDIASGTEMIKGSWKNDLSLQLRIKL